MSNKDHAEFSWALRDHIIKLRLSIAMTERLDAMMARGGYHSRSALCRSLLLAIINDDAKAHGETPLDEAA